jgi:hypothetical protein
VQAEACQVAKTARQRNPEVHTDLSILNVPEVLHISPNDRQATTSTGAEAPSYLLVFSEKNYQP